jgi:hypothetical protein
LYYHQRLGNHHGWHMDTGLTGIGVGKCLSRFCAETLRPIQMPE